MYVRSSCYSTSVMLIKTDTDKAFQFYIVCPMLVSYAGVVITLQRKNTGYRLSLSITDVSNQPLLDSRWFSTVCRGIHLLWIKACPVLYDAVLVVPLIVCSCVQCSCYIFNMCS